MTSCSQLNNSDDGSAKALEQSQIPTETNTTASEAEESLARDDYMFAAHRGYSGEYPESTAEAYKGAFKKGFDAVECDVWESYSGSLLIQHDPTTTRTTGKRDYIWRLNKKSRYKYPMKYGSNIEKYKGKKLVVPTLQEVLRIVKDNNGYLFLHIKNNSKYSLSDKGVNKIMRLLHDYGLQDKTLIFGGMDFVKPFTGYGFKTGLFATPKTRKQFVYMANWCEKNKVDTMVLANMKCFRSYRYDRGIAKFLKGKNMDFGLYKVSSLKQYEYARDMGAWFSMSDNNVR